MLVIKSHRRQHIGTKLVDNLKTIARQKGAKRLRVEALINNQPAITFYQKVGLINSHLILEQAL
jgi:ribosomal protein S18 acetylase RimI-like enzyme